jgi:hypothetical protein
MRLIINILPIGLTLLFITLNISTIAQGYTYSEFKGQWKNIENPLGTFTIQHKESQYYSAADDTTISRLVSFEHFRVYKPSQLNRDSLINFVGYNLGKHKIGISPYGWLDKSKRIEKFSFIGGWMEPRYEYSIIYCSKDRLTFFSQC